ncbi:MAG: FKBP-type peptidyl-prolyl cis-trans isomerase [Alphaproteobacteria bacterium]|nr:FKBP-type peptidyl-prolyl cis-trans isomerase [Alphaproteobacteria bacterium]
MSTTTPPSVQAGSFLTLHYRLSGPQGDIINTFGGLPATLTLGSSELSPALEQRMVGMNEGQEATFELAAGEAFGQRSPDLIQWVSRRLLLEFGDPDECYAVGDVVQFPAPGGQGAMAGAVRQVEPERVLFDFNHPLADQPVKFQVRLIGVL